MKSLFVAFIMFFTTFTFGNDVITVPSVDLQKYAGKWYEVASIPQTFQKDCIGNTKAEYSMAEDDLIKVLNSCDTETGTVKVAEGRARIEDAVTNSKLKVTFVKLLDWVFAFGGNYWILYVSPDYSMALVGDPSRDYAWILMRTPYISKAELVLAEAQFKSQGYDTCKILTSVQTGGFSVRQPLCEAVLESI